MSDLSGRTTVVVGASRGFGHGIARAFAEAGAPVVALAGTGPALAELATGPQRPDRGGIPETGIDPWQGPVSPREVLVHMVEEYARHNGHADLLRERIDGRWGQ